MRGEQLSDAIIYDKLHVLKKDFNGYIERNTVKVDANLPVFFGYVVSALESSFPHLPDDTYDEFIDSIVFKVLDVSANIADFEYIRRVKTNALRFKKMKNSEQGVNIVIGLKLVNAGDYPHALEFLKKYALLDVKLGVAVAYCYHVLSLREFKKDDDSTRNFRPGEMELLARELMIKLVRTKPPLNTIKQLELDNPAFLEKIFWQMIFIGLEWFSDEQWFVETGLKNAVATHDAAMRKRMLDVGVERFYTDINILREMYYYNLENRDPAAAAGIVNQLLKQYPNDLEPVYLGLKLSLLTSKKITYHGFRKLALTKGMPAQVLDLFDFTFELLNNEHKEAMTRITDFETEFPQFQYYSLALRYIAGDFQSGDEVRVKRAKKVLLDSLDNYCSQELKNKKEVSSLGPGGHG
jgi:hypothetical protein